MDKEHLEFFFHLFSGKNFTSFSSRASLDIDGRSDSLVLTLLHDSCFKTSETQVVFEEKLLGIYERNPAIKKWFFRRKASLGENFKFIIWSAWKTISVQKQKHD